MSCRCQVLICLHLCVQQKHSWLACWGPACMRRTARPAHALRAALLTNPRPPGLRGECAADGPPSVLMLDSAELPSSAVWNGGYQHASTTR